MNSNYLQVCIYNRLQKVLIYELTNFDEKIWKNAWYSLTCTRIHAELEMAKKLALSLEKGKKKKLIWVVFILDFKILDLYFIF